MTRENTEQQQQSNPLAAERERLRQVGYTEAEISQIMVARAVGGGASHQALPQGMLSSVLGSLVAVGGYVAGLFTTIRHDVTTMLDASSKASARSGAFVSLLFKAVVIGVLGFAAWQEWQIHVVNAPITAAAQAQKAAAEAAVASEVAKGEAAKAAAAYTTAVPIGAASKPETSADVGCYNPEAVHPNENITEKLIRIKKQKANGNCPHADIIRALRDREIYLLEEKARCLGSKEECAAPYEAFKASHEADLNELHGK